MGSEVETCHYCGRTFTSYGWFSRHVIKCGDKYFAKRDKQKKQAEGKSR